MWTIEQRRHFNNNRITCSGFKPHPGHVVVPLKKTLYEITSTRWLQTNSKFVEQEFEEIDSSIDSSETPKQMRIRRSTENLVNRNKTCAEYPVVGAWGYLVIGG